ncbi:MAG TPA: MFS transporter [Steroidobacteraceae bacterium]|nr:MFS transporter [Steroidobacteraceae bacterium]
MSHPEPNSSKLPQAQESEAQPPVRRLPGSIWALGLTSMFMDTSSELVHSLLPLFMSSVLGVGMVAIGLIEGVAESIAMVTKVFSGALSDRLRRRKPLVVLGYGLAALTKPIFPLAGSISWVAAARFTDRVGKGIRGAPRDALIADITPAQSRGAAYGLRQALDSVGAFVGPLLALLFMSWLASDIRAVLWVSVAPAFIAVALLTFFVREPEHEHGDPSADPSATKRISWSSARLLKQRYWSIVALASIFTLARFSEAFLVLRAQNVGLAMGYVPLIMVVMNVVYAGLAYPAGHASDRVSHRSLLLLGLVVLIAADFVLAFTASTETLLIGAALWGAHMALTQGLFSKLIADEAPADLRGTAFGVYNLVTGVFVLLASVIAGALWSEVGPKATFLAGAAFASAAALGVAMYLMRKSASSRSTR